jgi:hypothetical protein
MPELLRHGKRPPLYRSRQLYRKNPPEKKYGAGTGPKAALWISHSTYSDMQIRSGPFLMSAKPQQGLESSQSSLESECAALKDQNRRLADEVQQLRSVLSKTSSAQWKDDLGKPRTIGNPDNRTAAAEMLASLDDADSEIVLWVLGNDSLLISDLLGSADVLKLMRVISMLANCSAAFVQNDSIFRTEFGRALFGWIIERTQVSNCVELK